MRCISNEQRVKISNAFGTPEQRFWRRVKKAEGCWNWQGSILPAGYGRFLILGKAVLTHRFSYELHKGPIPKGLLVCHSCDNPRCVNPQHLWLGTYADNNRDCLLKGRSVDNNGEKSGKAKLTNQEADEIRQLYSKGASQPALAARYRIGQSQISRIVRGNIYI